MRQLFGGGLYDASLPKINERDCEIKAHIRNLSILPFYQIKNLDHVV